MVEVNLLPSGCWLFQQPARPLAHHRSSRRFESFEPRKLLEPQATRTTKITKITKAPRYGWASSECVICKEFQFEICPLDVRADHEPRNRIRDGCVVSPLRRRRHSRSRNGLG